VFGIAFFGLGFIAAGLSIAFNFLQLWGAAFIGLMFVREECCGVRGVCRRDPDAERWADASPRFGRCQPLPALTLKVPM
jgi:hypothetical protein